MKNHKKNIWGIVGLILIFVVGVFVLIYQKSESENNVGNLEILVQNEQIENEVAKNEENEATTEIYKSEIIIHITGEIINEGIIKLEEGQRIADAIEAAGGITEIADTSKINLAFVLSDGQKVYIPSIYDDLENFVCVSEGSGDGVIEGTTQKSNDKVNINTATQSELETLTGIGPSIAAKIIEYRKEVGKFTNIEELKNVSGIGESKYEGLKEEVVVK